MNNTPLPSPQLSFVKIRPGFEDIDITALEPKLCSSQYLTDFIRDINYVKNDPCISNYAGNNYLHLATRYPKIFNTILDCCPKEKLVEQLKQENAFGETVLHKACQHAESLKYAVHSMLAETQKAGLSTEEREEIYEKIQQLLKQEAGKVTLFEVLITQTNAEGLDFMLNLHCLAGQIKIIDNLQKIRAPGESEKSIVDLAMKDQALRLVLSKYLPSDQHTFFKKKRKIDNNATARETSLEQVNRASP